ncbi:MAG: pyridoxamine 5'-phosphate oxidase family protein [Archangiaceae bacterium]|nr:pyridoxamine 5'-phosphate oxidase family protein [Archangiaceae bacterium]
MLRTLVSAADASQLVQDARTGTLATLGEDGAPLATLVAVSGDDEGRPCFLLSSLAEHTRNLRARPAASLLLCGPGDPTSLDRPRVTLVGAVRWLEGDEAQRARARFVETHPEAKQWVALADFAPARLEVKAVRFVGGFARAASLRPEDLRRDRAP